MKEAISVHAIPGYKPTKLVAERAPNQTDAEFNYAIGNYQQNTMPVYLDAVHTMQRAFSDNNWSIDYGEDTEGSAIREYLEHDLVEYSPLGMTFDAFMFQVVPSLKMVDAMGCIAYKPYYIPMVQTDEGEILIDGQTAFEPIPYYYCSDRIVAYEENKWYAFLSDEYSDVEFGGKIVREGLIYEVYDDTAIYKVVQVGRKSDYKFQVVVYHIHELGYCPVDRLKGIPAWMDGSIVWQSLFLYAVPVLNDVVLDSIMLRSVKAASVFPYRVMTGDMCTAELDRDGQIQKCDGNGYFIDFNSQRRITCTTCMGTGLKNRISPHGVLLLRPDTFTKEGELRTTQQAMYFVEPTINTPTFLRQEIDNGLDKARNVLHLRTSNSTVKGSEDLTATGMVLDEKALYSTVKMFSDQVFDLYEFGINTIGVMRYGSDFEMPVITRSITFDFATEYEYMERISLAIKNGLPPFVVYEIVYRYIKTMFYNETDRAGAFDLLITTDRLLVMPYDQINMETAKGTVAPWEVVLHDSGISIVKKLVEVNASFFDQDVPVQREQLVAEAKKIAQEAGVRVGIADTVMGKTVASTQGDDLGKIPLALQQIALARERAITAGDTALATQLANKMKELTKQI